MKHRIILLALSVLTLAAAGAGANEVRQALQAAAEEARASLTAADIPRDQTISVLPLANDPGRYLEGLLKMAVTNAGLIYVEGREDPFWDAIMAEVEWDERKMDMLDESTLTTFGRLQSTQLLLYGTIREARETARSVYVEVELHLSSIATKRHLWGDLIAIRYYKPGQTIGIVDLNPALRDLLREAFERETAALSSAPRLSGINRVALGPVAGDLDGYIRGLAENLLSRANVIPAQLDATTLGEIRQILRDRPQTAEAVLTGAVRDLSRTLRREEPLRNIFETRAEVQLRVESAADGSILWSQTIAAVGEDIDAVSLWTFLMANLPIVVTIAGALLALIVFILFLNAMRRSR